MSAQEELEFLKPWAEQAKAGGVLVLSPVRAALAQRLSRAVAPSVAYRFLNRHGWRKVAPDIRHPKSDPQIREEWKKLPEDLATLLKPEAVGARAMRIMFQDEARFGRMVRIRRC